MAATYVLDDPPDERHGRPFSPTIQDVIRTKRLMLQTSLPIEIIDMILDAAEYWPRTSQATRYDRSTPSGRYSILGGSVCQDALLLRCCPIGFEKYPGSPARPGDYMYGTIPQAKLKPLRNEYAPIDFLSYLPQDRSLRRLDQPCRKIVFTIISRDQGWANRIRSGNPFEESHTWFEVGLERFEKDDYCTDGCKDSSPDPSRPLSQNSSISGSEISSKLHSRSSSIDHVETLSLCHLRPVYPALRPCELEERQQMHLSEDEEAYIYDHHLDPEPNRMIQCNKRAVRLKSTYTVEWNYNDNIDPNSEEAETSLVARGRGRATGSGTFVRSLKLGDVITVWGKARFQAWQNHIDMVRVDIYWAV